MKTEQEKILNTIKQMVTAVHKCDIDGVMETYELQSTVVFEPGNPVTNIDDIREGFKALIAINPKFTFSGHEIFISNDIATHISPWKMSAKMPDGENIDQNGLSIAVLRQQNNGEWRMVIDNPHGQILMT